jgi:hypothetical protein
MRFDAGHSLGREKPVNADLLPAFLALAPMISQACWNIRLNSESGSKALAYRTNSEAGYPVYDRRCWCSNVRRLAASCAADAIVVQVGAKNQMRRSLVRPVC